MTADLIIWRKLSQDYRQNEQTHHKVALHAQNTASPHQGILASNWHSSHEEIRLVAHPANPPHIVFRHRATILAHNTKAKARDTALGGLAKARDTAPDGLAKARALAKPKVTTQAMQWHNTKTRVTTQITPPNRASLRPHIHSDRHPRAPTNRQGKAISKTVQIAQADSATNRHW